MKASTCAAAPPPGPPEFFSPQVVSARRFYLDLRPSRTAFLAVVCGGVETTTPDYAIHRRTFPYHSLEYVVRGRGRVRLQGRADVLHPGRVFAYGPGVPHDIEPDPREPLVKYFVDFAGAGAGALLESCGLKPGGLAQVLPPMELQAVFEELIRCGQRGSRFSAELCVRLLQCLALKVAECRAPLDGAETFAFATYQEAREHLQRHFLRLRTLKQASAECHVDGAYLCRLFRRYDHLSPYQYLLRLKMNHAAALLGQPGALVKQAAEAVGFGDPFHFSRAFKAVLGLSPDHFRRLR
jgi:AraC-like DNA-binding protein/quercetin dioxygenase-like cupin family protein